MRSSLLRTVLLGIILLQAAAWATPNSNFRCLRAAAELVLPPLSAEDKRLFEERALPIIQLSAPRLTRKFAVLGMQEEDILNELSLHILYSIRAGELNLASASSSYLSQRLTWLMHNKLRTYLKSHENGALSLDSSLHDNPPLGETVSTSALEHAIHPDTLNDIYRPEITALWRVLQRNASIRFKRAAIPQDLFPIEIPPASSYQGSPETWTIIKALVELHANEELSNRDVAIFFDYYFRHETTRLIGQRYGLDPSRIARIMQKVAAKIQDQIGLEF